MGGPSPPGSLRDEGEPCGVIRNRREAAVSGANPEIAVAASFPKLWQEPVPNCHRPGDLKESSGKPF
jgi:hypothetical protein